MNTRKENQSMEKYAHSFPQLTNHTFYSSQSTNYSGVMVPTRNVTMRNLRIKSRNWCVGSATFGGIFDLLFEDSTIGDPDMVCDILFERRQVCQ